MGYVSGKWRGRVLSPEEIDWECRVATMITAATREDEKVCYAPSARHCHRHCR